LRLTREVPKVGTCVGNEGSDGADTPRPPRH